MKKNVDLYELIDDAKRALEVSEVNDEKTWKAIISFLTCYIGEEPILEDVFELPVTGDVTPLTEEELEQLNK